MKRLVRLVALAAVGLIAATSVFAQAKKENLLFTDNLVLPAEKIDYAGPMSKGKAPSGKDAIIVKPGDKNGYIEYRWRVDFKKPVAIRTYKKLCFEWEALDEDIQKAKGTDMNISIITLCKDDNKKLRNDPTGDISTRDSANDKRSFLMAAGGFLSFAAELDFEKDSQGWTDTTVITSTKQVTGIEIYHGLGADKKVSDGKGIAVTALWFE